MTTISSTRDSRFLRLFSALGKLLDQGPAIMEVGAEWQRRRCYRKDLKRLMRVGPYMIEDIGLTLGEARREIQTPFWRA